MDVHKPKPWHSVREFLKEYAIIVVGVLTALAAEQGVEWLHWTERVEAAEKRLRRELGGAYVIALERSMIVPCLDRRLAALKTALLSGEGQWTPLPPMHGRSQGYKVFFVPNRIYEDQAWKSVEADGTAAHISPADNALYGRAYATAAVFAVSGVVHDAVISVPARGGYGLPTLYFLLQLAGLLIERTAPLRRLTRRHPWLGRAYAIAFTLAPAPLLFHGPFVRNVIPPFLYAIGGLS